MFLAKILACVLFHNYYSNYSKKRQRHNLGTFNTNRQSALYDSFYQAVIYVVFPFSSKDLSRFFIVLVNTKFQMDI